MIFKRSFYIETYGCSFNLSDSSKTEQILIQNKFIPVSISHAEFIIINTCAVKSQTQEKILYKLSHHQTKKDQKIVVMGCLPGISDDVLEYIANIDNHIIAIIDNNSINDIVKVLNEHLEKKEIIVRRTQLKINKNDIFPWIRNTKDPGIIQISEGCNRNCSYCCTKTSRGNLFNFSSESIIKQIDFYLDRSVNELFLTAQDCGLYHNDNLDLAGLLEIVQRKYKNNQNLFIRIGMLDPGYLIKNLDRILKIIKIRPFYHFLHIPIQSASNVVLKDMHRDYRKKDLILIFDEINKNSDLTISTDIICGYPTETDADFNETVDFIEKYQPDIINISKFTPRPNTYAKKLKQLDSKIVKKRTELLTKMYNSYMEIKNKKWIGWDGFMIINQSSSNREYKFSGRNRFYKSIAIKKGKKNEISRVRILDSNSTFLIGEIIG